MLPCATHEIPSTDLPQTCQINPHRLEGFYVLEGGTVRRLVVCLTDALAEVSCCDAAEVFLLFDSWSLSYFPCVVLLGVGEGSHGGCQLHFITIHSYPMAAARSTSIHSFDLFSVLLFSFITSLISVLFYYFLFYLMFYPRYILESRPTIPICLWNLPTGLLIQKFF